MLSNWSRVLQELEEKLGANLQSDSGSLRITKDTAGASFHTQGHTGQSKHPPCFPLTSQTTATSHGFTPIQVCLLPLGFHRPSLGLRCKPTAQCPQQPLLLPRRMLSISLPCLVLLYSPLYKLEQEGARQ